jgi:hypothetical protein
LIKGAFIEETQTKNLLMLLKDQREDIVTLSPNKKINLTGTALCESKRMVLRKTLF